MSTTTAKRFQLKPVPVLIALVAVILLSTSIQGCRELGAIAHQLRLTQEHLATASTRIDSVAQSMQTLRQRLVEARAQIDSIDASVGMLQTNLGTRMSGLDRNLARLRSNLDGIDAVIASRLEGRSVDPDLPQPTVVDIR